jgi:hypothetical protein
LPDPALSTDPSVENLNNAKNALVFTGGAASLEPAFKKLKTGHVGGTVLKKDRQVKN